MTHTTQNGKKFNLSIEKTERLQAITVDFIEKTKEGERIALILYRMKKDNCFIIQIKATRKDGQPAPAERIKEIHPALNEYSETIENIEISKTNAIKLIEKIAELAY